MKAARKSDAASLASGILPGQGIAALVEAGAIAAQLPVGKEQIQPASLDLRLGARAWRVRASFLPSAKTGIHERLEALALHVVGVPPEALVAPSQVGRVLAGVAEAS